MSTLRKMNDSRSPRLLVIGFFLLCLAVPAMSTAASPASLAARPDDPLLPLISQIIDPPEIPIPKPPPPACLGPTAIEQMA